MEEVEAAVDGRGLGLGFGLIFFAEEAPGLVPERVAVPEVEAEVAEVEVETESASICLVARTLNSLCAGPVTDTKICLAPSSEATPTPPPAAVAPAPVFEARRDADEVRQATSES